MSFASIKGIVPSFVFGLLCTGCVGSGDAKVPLPLVPVAAVTHAMYGERVVASIGKPLDDSGGGQRVSVSDHFGKEDLRLLHEFLNSSAFQAQLTNYNCGDPVPKFTFCVSLIRYPGRATNALSVEWHYAPHLELRDRGLDAGIYYSVEKAFAKCEAARTPNSWFRVLRAPHVDCSRRPAPGQKMPSFTAAGPEDWVTRPGPDEVQW